MIAINPFAGSGSVREAHRFDEVSLASWLQDELPGFEGPLVVEQFKGGQSNPTYKLITPSKNYVLRRKPAGPLLKGAHAVEREAKVMTALGRVGFPVPRIQALCTDNGVVGTWFYIMDFVEGRIFWHPTFEGVSQVDRPAYFDAMNETIARLHSIDADLIGLTDYGRQGRYLERQISRWSNQYLEDREAGRDPNMDRLVEWLPGNIPQDDETSLIHGDFRVDNLVFHPVKPEIIAVLDWELSTLGHPLADFAYHLMMYRMPSLTIAGLADVNLAALNIPTEHDYVKAYCARTGRPEIRNLGFYLAFNLFRFAAIIHGVKGRARRGNAASAQASALIEDFPRIAEMGWIASRNVDGTGA